MNLYGHLLACGVPPPPWISGGGLARSWLLAPFDLAPSSRRHRSFSELDEIKRASTEVDPSSPESASEEVAHLRMQIRVCPSYGRHGSELQIRLPVHGS